MTLSGPLGSLGASMMFLVEGAALPLSGERTLPWLGDEHDRSTAGRAQAVLPYQAWPAIAARPVFVAITLASLDP